MVVGDCRWLHLCWGERGWFVIFGHLASSRWRRRSLQYRGYDNTGDGSLAVSTLHVVNSFEPLVNVGQSSALMHLPHLCRSYLRMYWPVEQLELEVYVDMIPAHAFGHFGIYNSVDSVTPMKKPSIDIAVPACRTCEKIQSSPVSRRR